MIRFTGFAMTFEEVPDEVSMCFTLSNCPFRCPGCHSPELQQDKGMSLSAYLCPTLDLYKGRATCVCFLGDGKPEDADELLNLFRICRERGFKVAHYSGMTGMQYSVVHGDDDFKPDYVKVGPYIAERGGLSNPGTNQRMYQYDPETKQYKDITYKFWNRYQEIK